MILQTLYVYSFHAKQIIKKYDFNDYGLNIILGEKKEQNAEANTVGKTTMVETIKYILAGSIPRDFNNRPILAQKELFLVLKVKHNGDVFHLGRLINDPEIGYILKQNDFSDNITFWEQLEKKEYSVRISSLIFGDKEDSPSLSALKEYIFRDEKNGFNDIVLVQRNAQYAYMYLAYLCGLPFNSEKEIAVLKKREKEIRDKIKIITSISDKIQELRIEESRLVKKTNDLENMINTLNITEKIQSDSMNYKEIKSKLEILQNKIFELENNKGQYEKNIHNLVNKVNQIKEFNDVKPFYDQLIGYFPSDVHKNYDEILNFYNFMVENRGEYFKDKISVIEEELKELYAQRLESEQALTMCTRMIKNKEFVGDLSAIINDISRANELLAEVRIKIQTYNQKNELNAKINRLKEELLRLTQIKHDEFLSNSEKVKSLKDVFNTLMRESYNEEGCIDFEFENATALKNVTGRIKIKCSIPDEKSHGRWYMKINMFDLMWFVNGLQSDEHFPITFLVHDGSYCKPDRDIKARLLKYVNRILTTNKHGQYIVTINEDELKQEDIAYFKEKGSVIAELDRENNDKNRFLGFKYTS